MADDLPVPYLLAQLQQILLFFIFYYHKTCSIVFA